MAEDLHTRRGRLSVMPAPHPRHDAIVSLTGHMDTVSVRLRYVPDRDLLTAESYRDYLSALGFSPSETFETIAQTILEDINDQVIPCWLEVLLTNATSGVHHEVRIEDRQPKWNDRGLLDRLSP